MLPVDYTRTHTYLSHTVQHSFCISLPFTTAPMMMMHLILAALLASCHAFAPKTLHGSPRRTAKRQALQMNVITDRPARAALAAAYVGFAGAIATFPGEFNNPADIQLIQDALNDPTSMNPVFFFVFNSLGLIPAVNAAVLLPGAKDQKPIPAAPFVASRVEIKSHAPHAIDAKLPSLLHLLAIARGG